MLQAGRLDAVVATTAVDGHHPGGILNRYVTA